MKLFIDANVALAAAGQKKGASRAIFDAAQATGWELQVSNYVLREAQFASLRVFHIAIQGTHVKNAFLRAVARNDHSEDYSVEDFLHKSFKAVTTALLRCSAGQRKNEPAFYKAVESVKPAMVKPAAVKRTTVKRAVFPDGAEVSLPRRTHASRAKKATKLASRAKSAHPHPAEPAAVQDPSIESTSDTAAMKTDISAARHRQPKDQAQDAQAQAPQHCTNLVCWLKQRRTKP